MLEYTKTILGKVSFDKSLFKRELEKSLSHLEAREIRHLVSWLHKNYGRQYPDLIEEFF